MARRAVMPAPSAASSSFTLSISRPWASRRSADIPFAMGRPTEWSVMATWPYPLAEAASIISRTLTAPSLYRVCICRSGRTSRRHASCPASVARTSARGEEAGAQRRTLRRRTLLLNPPGDDPGPPRARRMGARSATAPRPGARPPHPATPRPPRGPPERALSMRGFPLGGDGQHLGQVAVREGDLRARYRFRAAAFPPLRPADFFSRLSGIVITPCRRSRAPRSVLTHRRERRCFGPGGTPRRAWPA